MTTLELIEAGNVAALESLQIRGGWQTDGRISRFVGYDYANQRWIEHIWYVGGLGSQPSTWRDALLAVGPL